MITVRNMRPEDLPRLRELSPEDVKPAIEFTIYPTLVAVTEAGEIAGYAQFSLGPDKILHSLAIRVDAKFKGQGVGSILCAERARVGRAAGAGLHIYAVAPDGEVALKKILVAQGMHLCRKHPDIWLYTQYFGEEP